MKNLKLTIIATLAGVFGMVGVANAHLVSFGWKDNGNGTVTMWGQHWHGAQSAPSTANGGVRIGDPATDPATWPVFQWTGFTNSIGGDTTNNDALVTGGTLTGWEAEPGNWGNTNSHDDWFYTDPLVIGNGTWGLFTGTSCCIDTMNTFGIFTLTGIISVDPGTGPGTPGTAVPEPAALALFGLGLAGIGFARRKKA